MGYQRVYNEIRLLGMSPLTGPATDGTIHGTSDGRAILLTYGRLRHPRHCTAGPRLRLRCSVWYNLPSTQLCFKIGIIRFCVMDSHYSQMRKKYGHYENGTFCKVDAQQIILGGKVLIHIDGPVDSDYSDGNSWVIWQEGLLQERHEFSQISHNHLSCPGPPTATQSSLRRLPSPTSLKVLADETLAGGF